MRPIKLMKEEFTMKIKSLLFAMLFVMMGWVSAPMLATAGTLAELQTALTTHNSSGAISDADVYQMLSDLLLQAQAASDSEAENASRGSFIDVCNAFRGTGITSSAADDMVSKAQP